MGKRKRDRPNLAEPLLDAASGSGPHGTTWNWRAITWYPAARTLAATAIWRPGEWTGLRPTYVYVCTGFSQPWRIALPVGCVTAKKASKAERAHTCRGSDMRFVCEKGSQRNFTVLHGKPASDSQCHHYPFWGAEFHAVVPLQTRRKILGFARRMSIDFRRQHLIALLASNNEESRRSCLRTRKSMDG